MPRGFRFRKPKKNTHVCDQCWVLMEPTEEGGEKLWRCPKCGATERPVNKLHARKKLVDGVWFASGLESRVYERLRDDPDVYDLKLQPKHELQEKFRYQGVAIRAINYILDFEYHRHSRPGILFIVDAKGYSTPESKLKVKIFQHQCKDNQAIHFALVRKIEEIP